MTTMKSPLVMRDQLFVALERPRELESILTIKGQVHAQMFDGNMKLKGEAFVDNLITQVGDIMYAHRGAGISSPPNAPTGMKLGTGSTAPAKTGAGAALVTYLTASQHAFDATFPSIAVAVVTYKVTYAPGEATSAATPITEAVIVNETLSNATSAAAATISRALIAGVGSKQAADTLVLTWTHTALGA